MKRLMILMGALILSGCSIQAMVEKTVPENVRANHTAHIDRLLDRDTALLVEAFDLDLDNKEIAEQLAELLENVPDGAEIRRDYVGMNSSTTASLGEGKTRNISLVTEVQTQSGFMTVTSQYALDAKGNCCALTNINVQEFETSPVRMALESAKKIGKIIGLGLLGLIGGLVFFLIRRRKKKAARAG